MSTDARPTATGPTRRRVRARWRWTAAWVLACSVVTAVGPAQAGSTSSPPPGEPSYALRSWRRHDGLRGSQVWAVAQGADGYLWLGTNEGLARFDGVRFVSGQALGEGRLPSNSVRALRVARDGALWIGFGGPGGVSRLNGGELRNFSATDGLPEALITSLFEDHDRTMWAGSLDGLYRLRGDRWERVTFAGATQAQLVDAVFEDATGALWLGTPAGVFRRQRDRESFDLVTSLRIESFAEDAEHRLWGTGSDAALALLTSGPPRVIASGSAVAGRRLLQTPDGHLWVATLGGGLLRLTVGSGEEVDDVQVRTFRGPGVLSSDVVRALHWDREGNLWAGTQNGLDRVSTGVIQGLPIAGDSMSRLVRAVAADRDGSIWVGTGSGLYHFAGERREYYGEESGLPGLSVSALHGDRDGAMWVVTERGIGRMRQGRFIPVPGSQAVLSRPIAVTSDTSGRIWLADLDRGVWRWDGKALVGIDFGRGPRARSAFAILADRQDRVWTGFVDGTVGVVTPNGSHLYSAADGLSGGMITSLYEDRDGTIWIGASSGLMRFRGGRFEGVSWTHGLPGNIVGAIAGDETGTLWLGVSAGIVRVEPSAFEATLSGRSPTLEHVLYDASDGLRGDPIGLGHPTVTRDGSGTLWFVTSDGLALLSPERSVKNRAAPPVLIEAVMVDRRPMSLDGRSTLPPLTASVQIDYAAPTFTAPENVRFQYFMEGFDRDWIDAGSRRQAFYTNLQPGHYRFRVRASNDGVWSEREAVWAFELAPAFYETRWFAAALVLLTGTGLAGAWRARVHRVRGRFSAILVERTRVAREIHDTLLQSLLGVMLQLDQAASDIDDAPQSAKDRLGRLRQQVEFHIREARHSIRDLRSPVLQTRDLPSALGDAGAHLTAGTPISFEIDVSGTPFRCAQRVEEHLLRIGQEAISNAVRHGQASTIRVSLAFAPGRVTLRVSDDGVGFDAGHSPDVAESHWGLSSMRERAEQVGGACQIDSRPGHGTTVEVTVPVQAQA
ncbi:MAG: two-component regulator propeller domain-containing protein [Vicinamibacterales bacterium]